MSTHTSSQRLLALLQRQVNPVALMLAARGDFDGKNSKKTEGFLHRLVLYVLGDGQGHGSSSFTLQLTMRL